MTLWFTDVLLKPAAARCHCCRAVVNVVNAAEVAKRKAFHKVALGSLGAPINISFNVML